MHGALDRVVRAEVARIRSLKPEIWLSPQVMNLCHGARLLFVGLITQADDQGRGTADPRRLKAAVFPGDDVGAAQVDEWLELIAGERLAMLYPTDQHGRCFWLPSWFTHQSINKPKPSNYPPPPGMVADASMPLPVTIPDESRGKGGEWNGSEGRERASGTGNETPEGLDLVAWHRWLAYRHELRKPIKGASREAAMRSLAKFGADQAAVVEQSIANGWQGLFALKQTGSSFGKPAAEGGGQRIQTEAQRVASDRIAEERVARGLGIDPIGKTMADLTQAIWERQQANRGAA